jgi:hypothetical protein
MDDMTRLTLRYPAGTVARIKAAAAIASCSMGDVLEQGFELYIKSLSPDDRKAIDAIGDRAEKRQAKK